MVVTTIADKCDTCGYKNPGDLNEKQVYGLSLKSGEEYKIKLCSDCIKFLYGATSDIHFEYC